MVVNPITGKDETLVDESPNKAITEVITEEEPISATNITESPVIESKTATIEEPVVDRGISNKTEPIKIEVTRDNLIDVMSKNPSELTPEEESFLRGIKARQNLGEDINTILGEKKSKSSLDLKNTADLLTNEDEVSKIVSNAQGKILGQNLITDDVIKDSLIKQGYTSDQADTILIQRDLISKGKEAVSGRTSETEERIERRSELVREQEERDVARIKEQTERVQNQTQRLRSLRGVGRSSATESEILDLEEQGNELIKAAQTASDLAVQKIILEEEGAEAEAISSINKQISEAQNVLDSQLESSIEAQKIIDSQLGNDFNTSINNMLGILETGGVDTTGIDTEASKKLGYFVNKDGSLFKNNSGNPVEFKVNGVDAEAVDAFADEVLRGESITSIPTDMRASVIKSLAVKRQSQNVNDFTITPKMNVQARQIAKDFFGSTSDDNVAAVEALMLEGKTSDEIKRDLSGAGFSETTPASYENAINSATKTGFSKDEKSGILEELQRRIDTFGPNSQEVNEYLLGVATDSADTETRKKVDAKIQTINAIGDIQEALNKYVEKGGKTDILTGNLDKLSQKILGDTGNAELAEIGNRIQLAIQAYRQGVSGAAFSESEAKEYENIFPTGTKSIELNQAKMDALIKTFGQFTNDFYKGKLGASAYGEIFPDGVMTTFNPILKTDSIIELDDETSSEVDSIFGNQSSGPETFKVGNKEFNIDLSGLTNPDTTGGTNISSIGVGKVTQNFGDTSPLSIDNQLLANGKTGTPGIDIDGNIGDIIPSTIKGTVKKVIKSKTGLGNSVIILDEQGNEHYFNHLNDFNVEEGQEVEEGFNIGTMGNSGSVIKGPGGDGSHLDYRVKSNKGWIDPNEFLKS